MLENLGPIVGTLGATILAHIIAFLVWKGRADESLERLQADQDRYEQEAGEKDAEVERLKEATRQLRVEHDRHIEEAKDKIGELQFVRQTQAVMKQEIIDMAARLAVGDERLRELNILGRNFAVMESQLKGILGELVEIKTAIKDRAA